MRSLRMKLVMIMVLLIAALMAVVGSFLINGVGSFYIRDFYDRMSETFTPEFLTNLSQAAEEGPDRLKEILMAQSDLGIDLSNRNAYVLDAFGVYITGSTDSSELGLELTPNIITAIGGSVGQQGSLVAGYMDVAVPVKTGDTTYIIYIRDNKRTVNDLNSDMLGIIFQSLALGLVICVVLSFLLAQIMITPIENLTIGTKSVASGNFTERLTVHSRDEIGVLTVNFNEMSGILKSTLEEVSSERNKLSTLFMHMTDGVVAFNRNGEIIHSNPAGARMLRRDLDESTCYDEIFGDIEELATLLALPNRQFVEAQMHLGDSDLELFLAPFSGEETGGALAVIHDVTEQRKAEQMRREFVANVSHELRTPLTNIKSYVETVLDAAGDMPQEMEAGFLGVVLNETDRMTRIVQDLLTLSRFDYGKMEMNYIDFDFGRAVRSVYDAVALDAQSHGHELLLHIDDGLGTINGDKERIEQVIMNIVSNAIKYTPDGGRIELRAEDGQDEVRLTVSDNGIGIPVEDLPRLFERFYRVDKARSREAGGSGLGLSIAQEIIREHKGDIVIDSVVGKGTTVTITLPKQLTMNN